MVGSEESSNRGDGMDVMVRLQEIARSMLFLNGGGKGC